MAYGITVKQGTGGVRVEIRSRNQAGVLYAVPAEGSWVAEPDDPEIDLPAPKTKIFDLPGNYRDPDPEGTQVLVLPDFIEITQKLVEFFDKNPDSLHRMHRRYFERLLEAVFRNQGYTTELRSGCNDGGIDLRLLRKDPVDYVITLVRVNRRDPKWPIRLAAVEALFAVVDHKNANRGLLVWASPFRAVSRRFDDYGDHRLVLATSEDVAAWCKAAVKVWGPGEST